MKKKWGNYLFVLFMLVVAVVKYDEKYPIANPFAKLNPIKGVEVTVVVPEKKDTIDRIGFRRDSFGDDLKAVETLSTNGIIRRTGNQYWRMSWVEPLTP